MNKAYLKSNIISFILGAVIFTTGTVLAYSIFANEVGFTPTDSEFTKANGDAITNVEEALDALFVKASKKSRFEEAMYVTSQGDELNERTVSKTLDYGKYIVLINYGNNWWNTNSYSAHGIAEINPLTCSGNNCFVTPLSGYYNRQQPSYTKNGRYNYNSDLIFSYYVKIYSQSSTVSSTFNAGWADPSDSQYITMTIIPINE